ncbi:MAG: YdbL family protein [Alphaproteobacteria bacterium]|nr:YdbL family protein [Alphaproteobacteria bacterium]NCQ67220.1 YdbL family protein [Alphaproteobacteria bacterium]NCT07064.1 YdbL family protein [Alphaproteobacteria bacterium]
MKKILRKIISLSLAGFISATVLSIPTPVQAHMSAQEAKQKKLIEERGDGYVRALSPEGEAIAAAINQQRRASYEDVARQTGATPAQVAQEAAGRL